jgi:hypothetical protein
MKTREINAGSAGGRSGSHLAPLSGGGAAGSADVVDPRDTGPTLEYSVMEHHGLIERVRSEFLEMPGLRLTPAQAARLWNVDPATCQHVISTLVGAAFLRWTPRGTVMRVES